MTEGSSPGGGPVEQAARLAFDDTKPEPV